MKRYEMRKQLMALTLPGKDTFKDSKPPTASGVTWGKEGPS
jgi:hypothetical protein